MRTATATAAFEPTEAWQLALAADATVDVLKVDDAAPAREGPRAERLRPAAGGPAARLRDRHGAAAAGGHGPADVARPRPRFVARGSTVPAQATNDDLHAAAAVPHAAGAGPAGRPRDAAGVRAARGGAAAAGVVDTARVPGFRAEAPRGRGGLAPRLTIPLPPIPLTMDTTCVIFSGRGRTSQSRALEGWL